MSATFEARDDLFAQGGWIAMPAEPPFTLRHQVRDDRMYCETLMTVRGAREAAVRLFRGPWTWWDHGRATQFRARADGSTDQVLSPVWWYTTRIGLHIMPPSDVEAVPSGVRLPLHLSRHFVGLATIDVMDDAPGRLTIRGRFHGVESRVPFVPLWMAVGIHMRAESGTLLFPFPRGTGWRGMARALGNPAI